MSIFEAKHHKVNPERNHDGGRRGVVDVALTGLGLALAEELIRPIETAPVVTAEALPEGVTSLGRGAVQTLEVTAAQSSVDAAYPEAA